MAMLWRRKEVVHDREPLPVKGGVSVGAILTGVLVAFGALLLLSALIAGGLIAWEIDADELVADAGLEVGLGIAAVMVAAQFLSYLWGGYAAGRMARGSGAANGLLVPFVALILAALVGAIVAALGTDVQFGPPFTETRLPVSDDLIVDWGLGVGIASLVAMLLGGVIGGIAGARWHRRLEHDALVEHRVTEEHTAPPPPPSREVRLDDKTTVPPNEERTRSH
jgi:hypothetical protein